jgi:hypothetical protein
MPEADHEDEENLLPDPVDNPVIAGRMLKRSFSPSSFFTPDRKGVTARESMRERNCPARRRRTAYFVMEVFHSDI